MLGASSGLGVRLMSGDVNAFGLPKAVKRIIAFFAALVIGVSGSTAVANALDYGSGYRSANLGQYTTRATWAGEATPLLSEFILSISPLERLRLRAIMHTAWR